MSWAVSASGTQAATVGTEITLQTDTTVGTYYYEVDLSAMAAGDIVELRIYTMTLAAGTLRQVWKSSFGPGLPVCQIAAAPSQPSNQSIRVTLKQTAGTARSFPWKLLRI